SRARSPTRCTRSSCRSAYASVCASLGSPGPSGLPLAWSGRDAQRVLDRSRDRPQLHVDERAVGGGVPVGGRAVASESERLDLPRLLEAREDADAHGTREADVERLVRRGPRAVEVDGILVAVEMSDQEGGEMAWSRQGLVARREERVRLDLGRILVRLLRVARRRAIRESVRDVEQAVAGR